jgi:hypothetical protein
MIRLVVVPDLLLIMVLSAHIGNNVAGKAYIVKMVLSLPLSEAEFTEAKQEKFKVHI